MAHSPGLKAVLKRGALVAAANWPLIAVQFVAEATLKLLLAVPVLGGIFLVVLLLGADVDELLSGDIRDIVHAVEQGKYREYERHLVEVGGERDGKKTRPKSRDPVHE